MDPKTLTRKQFLGTAAGLLGLAVACGDDGGTEGDTGDMEGCTMDPSITIGGNHGHALTVPVADVEAAEDATYTLTGADHEHTLIVTAGHFEILVDAGTVTVQSSAGTGDGHKHQVELRC
jgi:hypothetical protein